MWARGFASANMTGSERASLSTHHEEERGGDKVVRDPGAHFFELRVAQINRHTEDPAARRGDRGGEAVADHRGADPELVPDFIGEHDALNRADGDGQRHGEDEAEGEVVHGIA